LDETSITSYITGAFDDVHTVDAWGDTFFYYNPDRAQPDEFYFATLKGQDDDYDRASDLNRPSVFRLNIGIGKATYRSLFGDDGAGEYDYTALDQLMPHPVYGRMYWVCVLNPSAATFETLRPLLAEAYDVITGRYARRAALDARKEGAASE
jgi:hypothetical protein